MEPHMWFLDDPLKYTDSALRKRYYARLRNLWHGVRVLRRWFLTAKEAKKYGKRFIDRYNRLLEAAHVKNR